MAEMRNLSFDTGVSELQVNGKGVLRYRPTDPNLVERFLRFLDELPAYMDKFGEVFKKETSSDEETLAQLEAARSMDLEIKQRLNEVFGCDNDFDALLEGVHIMTVASNGATVLETLSEALVPEIGLAADERAKVAMERARKTAAQLKGNREARRAPEEK